MAHGDADALGDAFAAEGQGAELFGDEAFGGEQVGSAEGADTVFAGLPGDDAGEQFQHVAFEVLGLAFGGPQAAFAKQLLRDVEDELAHGPGEAEEIRLVGAVDDHLPRLQQATRARHRQPERGGCLDHAAPDHRQHQRPDDDDRGEGDGDESGCTAQRAALGAQCRHPACAAPVRHM